ncbi:SHOCT domain-containing protein [Microbacterium invictum]|uniref:Type VI protein secretion system component VasK n=1 Tax=Microbacterium invictum TaxID=515415 RepID=A0AA40VKH6_9MICO|nr:SHOCT domain-containing protein [Microbacterium invictum]MBB4138584.1 type VI protein secretion system component VasK [Microbacterium invictum]
MDLWGWMAWFFWIFVFCAYLMVLFSIIGDLFRDDSVNGWLKAVWIIFLVFVPFLTALVYLIARGQGMQKRSIAQAQALREQQDSYIRATAASASASPAEDITKAAALLSQGVISQAEFDTLKAKALAG